MLDKAENPVKMLKLIITEMEDTLVEIKAACAQAMADQSKNTRRLAEAGEKSDMWLKRAEMAAAKGRDDLAREALMEKRSLEEILAGMKAQDEELTSVVERYRGEIEQLEAKLAQAREKNRLIAHRSGQAQKSLKVSGQMKRFDLTEAQLKLERLDSRLDRLEAEAELELSGRRPAEATHEAREKAFGEIDDSLDKELAAIKENLAPRQ
jgi:phage shock protein A